MDKVRFEAVSAVGRTGYGVRDLYIKHSGSVVNNGRFHPNL